MRAQRRAGSGSGAVWHPQGCVVALVLLSLFGLSQGNGFLPTEMRTAVEVPVCTSTSLPAFSAGEIFEASARLSAIAARTCCGSETSGSFSSSSAPWTLSTDTLVPGSKSKPAPSSSSRLPQSTNPGNVWGAFTLFHSASPKTLSMSLNNLMHSVSPQTPVNMYSVSLNSFKEDISCGESGNDLEVVIRSSWAVRVLARFIASARCDSASVASFLADEMSFSKESASCRAPRARVRAFADAACALLASSSVLPSESAAFPALVNASVAWLSAVDESEIAVLAFWSASPSLAVKVSRMVWFACSSRPSRTNTSSVNPTPLGRLL